MGASSRWEVVATVSAPAVSTRRESSAKELQQLCFELLDAANTLRTEVAEDDDGVDDGEAPPVLTPEAPVV